MSSARRDSTSSARFSDKSSAADETERPSEGEPLLKRKSMKKSKTMIKETVQIESGAKTLGSGGLEWLQDFRNVEDNYPKLDPDMVGKVAAQLAMITGMEPGDLTSVSSTEQFPSIVMFKRRAMLGATLLHFAIWYVVEFGADAHIVKELLEALDDPDDVFMPGFYAGGTSKVTFVSAVHLAAGLGQTEVLEMLMRHACHKTSMSRRMKPSAYVSQWAKTAAVGTPSEDYSDPTKDEAFTKFYQPVHDSTFAGNGDVTLWLLRNQADPCSRNKDQITPLHFVAFRGLAHGMESQYANELGQIVTALLRTGVGATEKANMKNFIPGATDVTPLEVAVEDASRFPQDHLGMLAPCLAGGSSMTYFEDIRRIADVTAEGALKLVQNIAEKGKDNQNILRRFRINAQMEGNSDVLASIFYTAPLAAAEMLELLEVVPEVEDAAHHSIPAKTSMWGLFQNVPMLCTYQSDFVKKDGLNLPCWEMVRSKKEGDAQVRHWHDEFIRRPRRQARSTYVKNVSVVASLLPGLLDIDVFMAFAHCQKEHLAIMNQKSVQGAIFCLWINLIERVWFFEVAFRLADVAAYVSLSSLVVSGDHLGSIWWPIAMAGTLHTFVLVVFQTTSIFRKWSDNSENSTMADMWSPVSRWSLYFAVPMLVQATMSSILLFDLAIKNSIEGHRDAIDDVLMAACLLIACFRFIWMWRLSVIGSRIFTIVQTFTAGAVNQILFILCMLLFAFIAALMVLSRLHTTRLAVDSYRGFLFGDGDGFNGLGMDIDHNAMFESNGSLLAFSIFGSFFFNVIVLNIIIAIYGHEYDRVERETPLLFMMGRADYCVKTILSYYHIAWRGEFCNRCLIVTATVMLAAGLYVAKFSDSIFLAAVLLACGQAVLPMALIQCPWFSPEGQDADDNQRYLWICHGRDWQWTSDEFDTEEGINDLQEQVERKIANVDDKIISLDDKFDKMMNLMQTLVDQQDA